MDLSEAIKGRRSIRKFKREKIPLDQIKEIIEHARWAPSACNRQLSEFLVIDDDEIKKEIHEKAGSQRWIIDAPIAILVLFDNRYNEEQHANIQSAAAAVQNMLLKSYELGIGSLWMAAIGKKEKLRKILNIPDVLEPMAFVLLGYPDEEPTPPSRRIDEIIHTNRISLVRPVYPASIFPENWSIEEIREYQKRNCRASVLGRNVETGIYSEGQAEEIIELIKDKIENNKSLLDVFSYDGTLLNILSKQTDIAITSYEMSDEVVSFINSKIQKKINYVIGGGIRLPFKDKSFDFVTCFFKLERLPNPEKIILELQRVLKDDGRMFITFFNLFSVSSLYFFIRTYILRKSQIDHSWTPQIGPFCPLMPFKVSRCLSKAGLEISEKNFIGLVPNKLTKKYKVLEKINSKISPYTKFSRIHVYECIKGLR